MHVHRLPIDLRDTVSKLVREGYNREQIVCIVRALCLSLGSVWDSGDTTSAHIAIDIAREDLGIL